MIKNTNEYNLQAIAETLKAFEVTVENGLSNTEVHQRIEKYGYNAIDEKVEALWHRIFRRFWGPIPWMIEIAALLS
ncbi:Lead, cadmium, zinc and mercury transporting ATPase; Copper-translocating P-type ATPase, partial [hydrothermal vent metagenome]